MCYRYGIAWRTFFTELGLEVVLDAPSDRGTLEVGDCLSVDECCLASKLFLGHVSALVDQGVDAVFVPSLMGYGRFDTFCTKFQALPDLAENAFIVAGRRVRVVSFRIDELAGETEDAAYLGLAARWMRSMRCQPSQAHRLGVEVEEFGEIALTSDKPANIAARCTVFAESDLVHKLQVGYEKRDVIAGLCRAVATNYLNNVGKGKKIEAPVVFQGGVSKNVGVVRAFEDALGQKVIVDPDGHLMGCFGAALLAADVPLLRSEPFMFDIDDFEFRTREVVCGHCANHCEIVCV